MPTNLPAEAIEAERLYRAAETIDEKIAYLEEYISAIPKHKGTDHLRADLRRRLSKLKSSAQTQRRTAKQVSPFHIDREGIGQVALVGPPNVGKSALMVALTNATPEVADYPFTTWTPTPGMMEVGKVQIQLIDTPPLNENYVEPEMLNLLRRVDLILLVVDLQGFPIEQIVDTVAILEAIRIVPDQRAERYTGEGRPTRVGLLRTEDCVGEMAMLTGERYSANVVANMDTEVVQIPREKMAIVLRESPELLEKLSEILALRKLETEVILAETASQNQGDSGKDLHHEYANDFLGQLKSFFSI